MDELLSQILLQLYQAAREVPVGAFEDLALEMVKPLLGFERSMWGIGAVTSAGLAIHNIHLHEEPEEIIREYEEVVHQDTVTFEAFKHRGATLNFHSPTLFKHRDTRGMRALVDRFKHQNMLATTNRAKDDSIQWISLYRADADRHYSERERLLCQNLVPHMMEALQINRVIHLDQMGMEQKRYARGFTDMKGGVLYAEPQLIALLQLEWPNWRGSLLPGPLLDAFVTNGGTRFRGREIAVRAIRRNALLFLGARSLCAADRLSPRELEVARHIAAGLNYKEIARQTDIAPATARNHTQAIYGKLEVINKAQLIAELNLIADD